MNTETIFEFAVIIICIVVLVVVMKKQYGDNQ